MRSNSNKTPSIALLWDMLLLLTMTMMMMMSTHAYRIGDAVGILVRTSTSSAGTTATIEAYRHQLPRFGISTRTSFDIKTLLHPEYLHLTTTTTMEEDVDEKQRRRRRRHANNQRNNNDVEEQQYLRLSLSFDDGFHHIPWVDVYNNNNNRQRSNNRDEQNKRRVLESLLITIIYSSGDGMIHAVHRDVKYSTTTNTATVGNNNIEVEEKGSSSSGGIPSMKFHVEYIWINEADVDIHGGILIMFVMVLVMSFFGTIGASSSYTNDDRDGSTRRGEGRYTTNQLALHEA